MANNQNPSELSTIADSQSQQYLESFVQIMNQRNYFSERISTNEVNNNILSQSGCSSSQKRKFKQQDLAEIQQQIQKKGGFKELQLFKNSCATFINKIYAQEISSKKHNIIIIYGLDYLLNLLKKLKFQLPQSVYNNLDDLIKEQLIQHYQLSIEKHYILKLEEFKQHLTIQKDSFIQAYKVKIENKWKNQFQNLKYQLEQSHQKGEYLVKLNLSLTDSLDEYKKHLLQNQETQKNYKSTQFVCELLQKKQTQKNQIIEKLNLQIIRNHQVYKQQQKKADDAIQTLKKQIRLWQQQKRKLQNHIKNLIQQKQKLQQHLKHQKQQNQKLNLELIQGLKEKKELEKQNEQFFIKIDQLNKIGAQLKLQKYKQKNIQRQNLIRSLELQNQELRKENQVLNKKFEQWMMFKNESAATNKNNN